MNTIQKDNRSRLYRVTAHWLKEDTQMQQDFIMIADSPANAKIMAHNRIPAKYTNSIKPTISDKTDIRVFDMGIPGTNKTYYSGPIMADGVIDAEKLTSIEKIAIHYGILWGNEICTTVYQKRSTKATQYLANVDTTAIIYGFAVNFINTNQPDSEKDTFFQTEFKKLLSGLDAKLNANQ